MRHSAQRRIRIVIHNHQELMSPALIGGITLVAAYIAGIASSLHCLVMCGGVAGALGMRARALGASAPRAFMHGIGYQIGRISSYVIAGALCGAFGQALVSMINIVQVGSMLHVLAGLLLIVLATRFLFGWRLLDRLERGGAVLWQQIAPLARRQHGGGIANSMLLGALWGWMPCGLVYSMLLFAALSGTAIQGAAVMAMFGLGTLPAMLGSTLLASQLQRLTRRPGFSKFSGALLLVFGVITIVVPLTGVHP